MRKVAPRRLSSFILNPTILNAREVLKDPVASFALITRRNLAWKEMTRTDGRVRADAAFSPVGMTRKKPPPSVTRKLLHVTRKRRLSCVHVVTAFWQISLAILKPTINPKDPEVIDSFCFKVMEFIYINFPLLKQNFRIVEYLTSSIKHREYH